MKGHRKEGRPEFQVVLMAGGLGNRMPPLTNTVPKALLPICNVPMVIYSLKMLERHRFSSVIMVVRKSAARDLRLGMEKHSVSLEIDLVTIPDESDMGTAESLRLVKDKIVTDFIVVSADLITDFELHHLADVHRLHDATVSCLLKATPERSEAEAIAHKKEKAVERGMVDYIGIDPRSSQVVFFENEENLHDEETIEMRKSVLSRHPRFSLRRDLLDAHLYIMAKWVIDFIAADKSISTIKGELIPFLVRKQFTSFHNPSPRSATLQRVLEGVEAASPGKGTIRCFAHVLPAVADDAADGTLCVRCNTTQLYAEVNRTIIPRWHALLNADADKTPMVDPKLELADPKNRKKQIGHDSMVDVGCKFGSKVSVKRAIIGGHCVLGDNVTVSDSILMGHVTVGDNCTVKNSIVSANVHVGARCILDRAQVGPAYEVAANTTAKNTQLTEDGLAGAGFGLGD